ncbi:MAG: hypothetical protein KAG94_05985 [Clostridiales bacterium]|nr:hypothetical protein [Clostridiales bacterium]
MKKILFICINNSCRSLMAEAITVQLAKGQVKCFSAGLSPTFSIDENAVMVMAEIGMKMDHYYPKKIDDVPSDFDIMITIGDSQSYPMINALKHENWDVEDPKGHDLAFYKKTLKVINKKVTKLLESIL